MVVVTVNRNTYGGEDYLRKACSYVTDPSRAIAPGGFGVDYTDAAKCFQNMWATKRYYGKTSDNPLLHIVISYEDGVKDADTAALYSRKIASYYNGNYQNVFCAHEKDRHCSHYHTHLVVNSTAYTNGHLINSWMGNMNQFCAHVINVTGQKVWLEFKNKAFDFNG